LGDEVLIKENHIAAAGSVAEAVRKVRARLGSDKKIEVEAENQQQVKDALAAGADIIMLDNMSPLQVKEMVALIDGAALVEVSGGINLDSIADYLVPGVDMISVGALTHSAPAADISMSISLS
jgi:nicotinate-nucleotide pyrophosphorylase (carboxylating)